MNPFADYRDFTGSRPEKHFKSTLFQSDPLMLGLNCLEPGQVQAAHAHEGAAKFYFVVEGVGRFTVGEETRDAGAGMVVWAAPGVPHGVENRGATRLVLLVGISPAPT
jgi:quercetin dioxygenase-like cupin family protein